MRRFNPAAIPEQDRLLNQHRNTNPSPSLHRFIYPVPGRGTGAASIVTPDSFNRGFAGRSRSVGVWARNIIKLC